MKRGKKMLLLVIVLELCIGGYYVVPLLTQTEPVSEEVGDFALTVRAPEELTGLTWNVGETEFVFTKSGDAWQKADEAAFPVDQEAVQALADALLGLRGVRQLNGITEPADYGLAEPAFTVTVTWSDGTSTTYALGDETPFGDSWYLSLSDQTGIVYTVEADWSSDFEVTRTDLASMEGIPVIESVTRMTVGSALDATYAETSTTINADQHWYDPDWQPLDGVDSLIADAQAIAWSALVEPAAENLSIYGLDAPTTITLYNGDDAALTLHIGTTNESGAYYARLHESNMVYTVASADVSSLLAASNANLRSTALVETAYAELAQAVFTADGISYTLVPLTSTEDNEEASGDPGEELWFVLTAVTAQSGSIEEGSGETLLTVQIKTAAGPEATLTLSSYDAESYVASMEGFSALVSADQVDKVLRVLKAMK